VDETLLKQKLGDVIRLRRLALRLSQEELGDRCGLHRTYIGSIERGERNISLQNIVRIAHALGSPAWEVLRAAEEGAPQA
jgi:transcriptional regulator with XRE-family HTH domain